eukprot:1210716-Pyramimonas_sp.AAC.1
MYGDVVAASGLSAGAARRAFRGAPDGAVAPPTPGPIGAGAPACGAGPSAARATPRGAKTASVRAPVATTAPL